MKKLMLTVFIFFLSLIGFSQRNDVVKDLVNRGIELHDNGAYEDAIGKYNEALQIAPKDYDANYEKSFSLFAMKKYDECIKLCHYIIGEFSNNQKVQEVYSILGSVFDDMGKADEALSVYTNGIEKYPNYYLLHFNKGLTYTRIKKYDEALDCYISALKLNGLHASSNYYTALILQANNRIPSLLAYITFIAIESQSNRSVKAYEAIQEIVYRGIKKEGRNTTINLSMDMLDDKKKKKKAENDFSNIDLVFSLLGTMDDSKGIDSIAKTAADKFDLKLQFLINSLENSAKESTGFYWEHYVPFFIEMKTKNYINVLSNIIYFSQDKDAQTWVNQNSDKVKEFYSWLEIYQWKG
jgi:tetratricopeptide (TPR) repeat protein